MKIESLKQIQETIGLEILETIGDGVSIQNTNYKILYENRVHKELIGDHVGEYCYMAYHGRKNVCEECPMAIVFKDGKPNTKEISATINNGLRFFEITASPIKDSDGKIIAGIEIVREVTGRKETEEKLKESEEHYRQLSDATFEGIIVHYKGEIMDVNQNFALMFGYDISELIGMNGYELFASETRDSSIKNIESGYEHSYESIGLRKDGTSFPMAIRAKPSHYKGRTVRVATVTDITEQKRAEKDLNERIEELEKFYNVSIGRELRMKELKEEIEELKSELLKYKNPQD